MFVCIAQRLTFIAGLLVLSACTSQNIIDIEGRDDNALYTVQTSFPVTSSEDPVYLKLRASRTSAEFLQQVPDGKYIFFQDIQITGSDRIAVESDIATTSISFGIFDFMMADKFTTSVFIGASQTRFNADVAFQSGASVDIRDRIREAYLDMGLWYRPTDRLKLGLMFAMSMSADISGYNEIELSLSYKLFSHLEVAAGLRDFVYNYNEGDSRSSLHIESKGPFVMLYFPF